MGSIVTGRLTRDSGPGDFLPQLVQGPDVVQVERESLTASPERDALQRAAFEEDRPASEIMREALRRHLDLED